MIGPVEQHLATVRRLSKPGGPLAVGAPTETIRNPKWFTGPPLLAAIGPRRRLHSSLVDDELDRTQAAPGSVAYVLAGPPGAGKSRVIPDLLKGSTADFLVINPDTFKVRLLETAIADGSFRSWITPREIASLEDQGERFFPLEFAALVHEESSRLAHLLTSRAVANNLNLVIDGVLADARKARELVEQLGRGGYKIRIIDVEVPYELSAKRIEERWRRSYEDALANPHSCMGGRWVPSEYARDLFLVDGESKCIAAAREAAVSCPSVEEYRVYFTEHDGDSPRLVQHMRRDGPAGALTVS